MSAIFLSPMAFAGAGSSTVLRGAISNLNLDHPALTAKFSANGYVAVDVADHANGYDCIAVIGSQLSASDTVTVETSNDNFSTIASSITVPAHSDPYKPSMASTKTIVALPTLRTERYVRVKFNASADVEFSRLVIGRMVSTYGIRYGAKMNFEDRSVITQGTGYTSIDRYDVLTSWEISTSGITDADWRGKWMPLLITAGSSRGILFVRNIEDPTTYQTDSVFGRISSKAAGEAENYNWWVFSATILSFAV